MAHSLRGLSLLSSFVEVTLSYDRQLAALSVDGAAPTCFAIPADWTQVPIPAVGSSHRACVFTLLSYNHWPGKAAPSNEAAMVDAEGGQTDTATPAARACVCVVAPVC